MTADFADATAFVLPSHVEGMSVVPADRNLTGAELELVTLQNRERRLRALVYSLRDRFD